MTINNAKESVTYKVVNVTSDEKISKFLKTLGLFDGQEVTVISKAGKNYVLNIKDSRYAIDNYLASKINIVNI